MVFAVQGLMAMEVPVEYGGNGMSFTQGRELSKGGQRRALTSRAPCCARSCHCHRRVGQGVRPLHSHHVTASRLQVDPGFSVIVDVQVERDRPTD